MKRIAKKVLTFATGLLLCSLCFGVQARAEVPTIEPTVMDDLKSETTQVARYEIEIPAGQQETVVPVTVKQRGLVFFEYDMYDDVNIYVYSDEACTDEIDYDENNAEGYSCWLEQGSYYLKISKREYGNLYDGVAWNAATVTVEAYAYSGVDSALEDNQWTAGYSGPERDDPIYYEINIPKRGYIRLEAKWQDEENGWIDCMLCNGKKKGLKLTETGLYASFYHTDFAVEKGRYYIKISNANCPYKIKYIFQSNPNKKNYTKKKAASLKSGETACGVFYSKDKQSTWTRWYKIKVTKKKRLKLSGWYSLFCDSKRIAVNTVSEGDLICTEKKVKPGTYYVVIHTPGWTSKTKKRTMGSVYSFEWEYYSPDKK